jgi:hypothetical protein
MLVGGGKTESGMRQGGVALCEIQSDMGKWCIFRIRV